MANDKKFSVYFYNWITYAGIYLAILVFIAELFLFAIDFSAHGRNQYLGLITYILLPPFLIVGLLMIPGGALWKRHRVHVGKASLVPKVLRIDPSVPEHRNALFVFLTGTTILVVMTLAGLYKGFHYTESVEFCGTLCHKIMSPEHTAYLQSPHSNVKCVECHIGAGAGWYVRSKLSGARQVVKAITGTYENPIKTPVHDLRPAKETCLECHSPGKRFGTFDMDRTYYLSDGGDPYKIRMALNIGSGGHQARGVHAHMNVENEIYYAAEDDKREKITWVKSVDKQGKETVFKSPNSKWAKSDPSPQEIRKMDCIDCHNRPTHKFNPPYRLMNEAMQYGDLDAAMPDIKAQGMEALSGSYKTTDEAMSQIQRKMSEHYEKKQADYYAGHKPEVEKAISKVQEIYRHNMFPEMKVRWDIHPDNIGHFSTPGCFRCHDNEHRAQDSRVITQDCKACHKIVEQGPVGATEKSFDGLEFKHPTDDEWQGANCTDCHTGGA